MKRSDWQFLARTRIHEAQVLLSAGCFEGAYYLAGYAVESALKACISKQTERYEFPDRKRAEAAHQHHPERLLAAAGLTADLEDELRSDRALWKNWTIVKDWSAASRYDRSSQERARGLLAAITDKRHGVLRWISRHW